jgi:hypothetical protein
MSYHRNTRIGWQVGRLNEARSVSRGRRSEEFAAEVGSIAARRFGRNERTDADAQPSFHG